MLILLVQRGGAEVVGHSGPLDRDNWLVYGAYNARHDAIMWRRSKANGSTGSRSSKTISRAFTDPMNEVGE